MFTISILYFDDTIQHFSDVDFFKFDSLYIAFGDNMIPTEDVFKVSVFLDDHIICQWLNE